MRPPVSPPRVPALLHGCGNPGIIQFRKPKGTKTRIIPGAHQLIQGLERVIDGEAISKPRHDPRVGFLVHLGGQEEGVAPEANPHGVLETLRLVTMQEVTPELVHRRLLCVLTDQGP